MRGTTIAVLVVSAMGIGLGARNARADWQCACYVDTHSFDRYMSGSWALECDEHGGHDDCPNDVDSMHSQGSGAMTGELIAESRFGNNWVYQHVEAYMPDDADGGHRFAFHGPDGGEWNNACSCDGVSRNPDACYPDWFTYHGNAQWTDPGSPMYSGPLEDHQEFPQQITPWFWFPFECNRGDQWITVFEVLREHDPSCCSDGMGQVGWALPANEGVNDYWVWGDHWEYTSKTGSQGGYFGMYVRHRIGCGTYWVEPPPPPDDGGCSGEYPCVP